LHGMAYYIFLKSWRSLEEFRKNPHLKIPPKSPSTNFQFLPIIKNQIFIRKRIFLHFRPIRPSGQPAYSASHPTLPPGLRFPHPACRPMPPPGLRPVARPSWPTREVVSLLAMQPPPRQAAMASATFPTSPSPYGRPLPILNPSLNHDLQPLFIPPLIPSAGRSRIPRPVLGPSLPLAPIKGREPPPEFTTPPQLTLPLSRSSSSPVADLPPRS
jgi:hypothetical protein